MSIQKLLQPQQNGHKEMDSFRDKFDSAVNGCALKSLSTSTIWSQSTLNKYWDLFQDTLISTANKTIPVSKSTVRRLSKQPIALSNLYENIRTLQKFSKYTYKCLNNNRISLKWNNLYDK